MTVTKEGATLFQSRNKTAFNTGAVALTVGELIAQLQRADPATPVVISGANGGFDGVQAVTERPLKLNVNAFDGFGRHDLPADGEQPDVLALAILCVPDAA